MNGGFVIVDDGLRVRMEHDMLLQTAPEAVRNAHALAGSGVVSVELLSRDDKIGLHLRLGITGDVAASIVRRVVVSSSNFVVVPGIEVSLMRSHDVVSELLRCIPLREDQSDRCETRLLWEQAVHVGPNLVGAVQAECSVTMSNHTSVSFRRWISDADGWVAIGFSGPGLAVIPADRGTQRETLTYDLARILAGHTSEESTDE